MTSLTPTSTPASCLIASTDDVSLPTLLSLPEDCLYEVFSFLDFVGCKMFAMSCSSLYELESTNQLISSHVWTMLEELYSYASSFCGVYRESDDTGYPDTTLTLSLGGNYCEPNEWTIELELDYSTGYREDGEWEWEDHECYVTATFPFSDLWRTPTHISITSAECRWSFRRMEPNRTQGKNTGELTIRPTLISAGSDSGIDYPFPVPFPGTTLFFTHWLKRIKSLFVHFVPINNGQARGNPMIRGSGFPPVPVIWSRLNGDDLFEGRELKRD